MFLTRRYRTEIVRPPDAPAGRHVLLITPKHFAEPLQVHLIYATLGAVEKK